MVVGIPDVVVMTGSRLPRCLAVWRGRRAIRLWTGELPRRPLVWIFALLHLATAVAIRFLEPDPEFTAPATAPAVDDRGVPAGRH